MSTTPNQLSPLTKSVSNAELGSPSRERPRVRGFDRLFGKLMKVVYGGFVAGSVDQDFATHEALVAAQRAKAAAAKKAVQPEFVADPLPHDSYLVGMHGAPVEQAQAFPEQVDSPQHGIVPPVDVPPQSPRQ